MMGKQRNSDAPNILHLIQKDSIGAEIGVWFANTSEEFVKKGVKELHLVDPYSIEPFKENSEMTYNAWLSKYNKLLKIKGKNYMDIEEKLVKYYNNVYETVVKKFKNNNSVKIFRTTSHSWFDSVQDNYFDWIYIDGDHSYEGCYQDLMKARAKVKKGGLILGDDFKWPNSKWSKPGVTKAVKQFVEENDYTKSFFRHGMTQFEIKL